MLEIIIIAAVIEHFLLKRYSVKKGKSFEAKIHNMKVAALCSIPFYIGVSLLGAESTEETVAGILGCILYVLFELHINISDAKKVHENEAMLDRDLSRIDVDEPRPSMRINLDSFNNRASVPEESTSDFDPNDNTVVYVSSRSEGRKYHAKDNCIIHCKPITRGEARSKGLRPCKLCNSGDNFIPKE